MALSTFWNKLTSRQQKPLRRAPESRGFDETCRLAATGNHAVEDIEQLLRAIQLAGGTVGQVSAASPSMAPAQNGGADLHLTPEQPSSNLPQVSAEQQDSFTIFSRLPAELRTKIWRHAGLEPRLAFVLLGMPTQTWVTTPNIDMIQGIGTVFYRAFMNRVHLNETNTRRSLLSASQESRHEILQATITDPSSMNWLERLGLAEYNIMRHDLVYLGGLSNGLSGALRDMESVIPLSLVLGNVLGRVMVAGDVFVRYFQPYIFHQPENPINKALSDLRQFGANYAVLFGNTGLPHPRLPGSMVFLLDNVDLEWAPDASPCTVPSHTERAYIDRSSCCIHHDHLEIIEDARMDEWMNINFERRPDGSHIRLSQHLRANTVFWIRHVWQEWRFQPNIAAQVPQLFFARVKNNA